MEDREILARAQNVAYWESPDAGQSRGYAVGLDFVLGLGFRLWVAGEGAPSLRGRFATREEAVSRFEAEKARLQEKQRL